MGKLIESNQVSFKTPILSTANLTTLHDFQKFLGDINWIRQSLKFTTGQLKPLFDILKGSPNPTFPRSLTAPAKVALQLVHDVLSQQKLSRIKYNSRWCYCVFPTVYTPTGIFWQQGILEWLHLPASRGKVVIPYFELVSLFVAKGRVWALSLFGIDPPEIIVSYSSTQQQWLWQFSGSWQLAFAGFSGQILCHYPADKLLHFYSQNFLIFPQTCLKSTLSEAFLAFTDVSSSGIATGTVNACPFSFQTPEYSTQHVELLAVQHVLTNWNVPLNIYSDSQYVVNFVQTLETAPCPFLTPLL